MLPSNEFYKKTDRTPENYVHVTDEIIEELQFENLLRAKVDLEPLSIRAFVNHEKVLQG